MGRSVHQLTHIFLIKITTQFLTECYTVFCQRNFTLVSTDTIKPLLCIHIKSMSHTSQKCKPINYQLHTTYMLHKIAR
jgi:hypothetical protein